MRWMVMASFFFFFFFSFPPPLSSASDLQGCKGWIHPLPPFFSPFRARIKEPSPFNSPPLPPFPPLFRRRSTPARIAANVLVCFSGVLERGVRMDEGCPFFLSSSLLLPPPPFPDGSHFTLKGRNFFDFPCYLCLVGKVT